MIPDYNTKMSRAELREYLKVNNIDAEVSSSSSSNDSGYEDESEEEEEEDNGSDS